MSPGGIRWVRIAGWVILLTIFAFTLFWAALVWLVIGLALWGAGALGLRLGERMRALGRGDHA
jgi:hypothetical protein